MIRALALFVAFVIPVTSLACSLDEFDAGRPSAIADKVDNQFAKFRWASDADTNSAYDRIWNYIWNVHPKRSLNAVWEKAGILIPVASPLPPGGIFCNHYFVAGASDVPDFDAPIVYGLSNRTQNAAVFVASDTSAASMVPSELKTEYVNEDGKKVEVSLRISSSFEDGRLSVDFSYEPASLVIGVGGLPDEFFKSYAKTLSKQIKTGNLYELFEFQPMDEKALFPKLKQSYYFVSGKGERSVIFEASGVKQIVADLIVFDRGQLVATARTSTYIPN